MSRRKPRQLGPVEIDETIRSLASLGIVLGFQQADNVDQGFEGCEGAAYKLFFEIAERHGTEAARLIFKKVGTELPPRELARRRKIVLLEQYDLMEKPNVEELARVTAQGNKALPRKEQRGAGSTSASALAKFIRGLLIQREKDITAGRTAKWLPEGLEAFLQQIGKPPHLK